MKSFNISKRILESRRKKGVTQEELADYIGVSKASVSKWERGQSFPDITILPLLASYFNISIDELMGYEPQMTKANIRKLYLKLSKDFSEKPFEEVILYCEDIVRRYFSSYSLLFQIASLYLNNSNLASDPSRSLEIISRARELFNRIRIESDDLNLINQATFMEAFCLLNLNEPEEAIALLSKTNTEIIFSASLIASAYQMIGEGEKARESIQVEMYQFLINLLQLLQSYLPLLEGEEDIKDLSIKYEAIVGAFNIKCLRPDLISAFYLLLAQEYMKLGNRGEALTYLKKYTDNVTSNIYPFELKGDDFFTLIENWINDFPIGNHAPRDESLIRESIYRALADNPIYEELEGNREYKIIIQRLKDNFKFN